MYNMKVNPGTVVCVGSGDLGEGVCVGEFFCDEDGRATFAAGGGEREPCQSI